MCGELELFFTSSSVGFESRENKLNEDQFTQKHPISHSFLGYSYPPFWSPNKNELFKIIISGNFSFHGDSAWDSIRYVKKEEI